MTAGSVRIDLRAALPIAALAIVVLVIIFVELCGREDVKQLAQSTIAFPSVTLGPTFTPGPAETPAPGETAPPPEPTATTEPPSLAEDRDVTRQADLQAVQQALGQYFQEHNEYPDTGGNIQTLCVFEDADSGCALQEFLDPLPRDPRGDPVKDGYFYRFADGRYTVFGRRESDRFPECPEHPDFLEDVPSLLCVQGP